MRNWWLLKIDTVYMLLNAHTYQSKLSSVVSSIYSTLFLLLQSIIVASKLALYCQPYSEQPMSHLASTHLSAARSCGQFIIPNPNLSLHLHYQT